MAEQETKKKGLYSEKVMEVFLHPHNAGELENPDGVGEVGNEICGDLMKIFIKVGEASQRITDISFATFGCAAAIATSSMITDLAKGKTLDDALRITRNNVSEELGGLPKIKEHCSNLAADGLHEAIYDYYTKAGKSIPPELELEHQRIRKMSAHEHEGAGSEETHEHGEPA